MMVRRMMIVVVAVVAKLTVLNLSLEVSYVVFLCS
jgi:hypothetical protein